MKDKKFDQFVDDAMDRLVSIGCVGALSADVSIESVKGAIRDAMKVLLEEQENENATLHHKLDIKTSVIGHLEHLLCQFKDAADELRIGAFPEGFEPFVMWKDGKAIPVQPERVRGIYEAFARKLVELGDFSRLKDAEKRASENLEKAFSIAEGAWGIIANAYGGNWESAPDEWKDAAKRWRDGMWHPLLEMLGRPLLGECERDN